MKQFAPLHIVSGYTFLQSGLTMPRIAKGITSCNYFGAGLTDKNVLFGVPEFVSTLTSLNKPYLIGMDIELNNDNLSLFALNEDGYHSLIQLSFLNEKKELDIKGLKANSAGLACVIETTRGSFKEHFVDNELDIDYRKHLADLSKLFPLGFYLGIEVTSKEEVSYANAIRNFVSNYPFDLIAFPRIRYLKKEDAICIVIGDAIANNLVIKTKSAIGQEYFMPIESYQKIYTTKEMDNTIELVKKSSFNFNQKRGEMMKFPIANASMVLKEKTYSLLNTLHLNDEAHKARLDYELDVINKMGYSDYFLLVEDYVKYAKDNGILVGPGRGSAAGSLVSHLLNITEIDPLEYDLQFERFLNVGRQTMPDIDVDFPDINRDEIVNYVRNKYGKDRVATIITFSTILAKQALRDIGRIYDIKESHISFLSKRLSNREYSLAESYKNLPDFKALVDSDNYYKEIVSLASKIEGLPRQHGIHAAGVILNNTPIIDAMPVILDLNDNLITQYEAPYLEDQGFLKMDFLALRNLTSISYALRLIEQNKGIHIEGDQIPYKEKEIIDLISTGQTMGLFQIESFGMKKAIKILKPTCFDDIIALLALFRPGPMDEIKRYGERKNSNKKLVYPSKDLEDILSSTFGVIVYQEQVNSIAVKMAGLSLSEADLFRRAISKKDKTKFPILEKQFIDGSISNGYSKEIASKIFAAIRKFSDYGLNKSHSTVYAIIACRMAYLKVHYPLEFYSALLATSVSTSDSKFKEYIAEMKLNGYKILPPDINMSGLKFEICENNLLFPLIEIKKLDALTVQKIIEERNENGPYKDIYDFALRMFPYKLSETQLVNLINAGSFDKLNPNRNSLRLSAKAAMQYAELNYGEDGQLSIGIEAMVRPNLVEVEEDPLENLDKEFEAIGVMLSSSPLDFKKELIEAKGATDILSSREIDNPTIAVIIKSKKLHNTKKDGLPMAYLQVYDSSVDLEVTVFSKLYSETLQILDKDNIILIKGYYDKKDEKVFIANEISLLEE